MNGEGCCGIGRMHLVLGELLLDYDHPPSEYRVQCGGGGAKWLDTYARSSVGHVFTRDGRMIRVGRAGETLRSVDVIRQEVVVVVGGSINVVLLSTI